MHEPMPLPPPDDEFDDSEEVTRESEIQGINRAIDHLRAQRFDDLANTNRQLHALSLEIKEANATSKRIEAGITGLAEVVGQLRDWIREVDNREQPRQTVRRKR